MSPAQAAAMNVGLLILVMLGLKLYVGGQRGKLKVPSGETTPEFSRVTRVQLNAVEDVPVLMVGLVALGLLGMPAWYIHMCGLVLVVSRIAPRRGPLQLQRLLARPRRRHAGHDADLSRRRRAPCWSTLSPDCRSRFRGRRTRPLERVAALPISC